MSRRLLQGNGGRAVALLLLALLPAACGRSCGCVEGKKTYETLDGKVKVALVRNTHWTGGRVGGPVSSFAIRVETTPPFEEPIGCDHVDMAEDDAGRNVAFRCQGTGEWTVLRLRGEDRRIRECAAPVGVGKKPDFAKLVPLRKEATRILDCQSDGDDPYTSSQIARAVREDDGPDAAVDLAVELASRPFPNPTMPDSWERVLGALDTAGRARAIAKICPVLEDRDGLQKAERWMRAVLRCPLDAPGIGDGALAVFAAALARTGSMKVDSRGRATDQAIGWSAILAAARKPKEAGVVACREAPKFARDETDARSRWKSIVGGVIVRTKSRCPEADAWLTPPPCSEHLDCDAALCSEAELVVDVDAKWAEPPIDPDAGVRIAPYNLSESRIALLLAYRNGPLSRDWTLPNQRRLYPFADAGTETSCADDELEAGAPCACEDLPQYERCTLDAGTTTVRYHHCAIHIDDKKRVLDQVRRVCERAGAACDYRSLLCCGGLHCKSNAVGPGGVCEPDHPADH